MAVYTGSQLSDLQPITADDDSCVRDGCSFAEFDAQAGQTYLIAVDGYQHAPATSTYALKASRGRRSPALAEAPGAAALAQAAARARAPAPAQAAGRARS